MRQAEVTSLCLDYLLNNKEHVQSLASCFITTRTSLLNQHDYSFFDRINEEFILLIKSIILVDLARNLPMMNPEQLVLFIDEFNVSTYLDWV